MNNSNIAHDWEVHDRLLAYHFGNNERDVAIEDAVSAFAEGLETNPAYHPEATINGVETPMIFSRASTIKCNIKAVPDTSIHVGDIVQCFDLSWLVVELYIDEIGVVCGQAWLCNEELTFQNFSGIIYNRPCVIDDGSYTKRSDPDAYVMSNIYRVYASIDNETSMLYVDKRLSFGAIYSSTGELILEVYKIVGIDKKSKNFGEGSHLMMITLQRDVYNKDTDSLELNVCDVRYDTEDTATTSPTGSCYITGRDTIRIGTNKKYIASFVAQSEEDTSGISALWSITCPEGISYFVDGNICTFDVPLNANCVGKEISITISAKPSDGDYGTFTKKVMVVALG